MNGIQPKKPDLSKNGESTPRLQPGPCLERICSTLDGAQEVKQVPTLTRKRTMATDRTD